MRDVTRSMADKMRRMPLRATLLPCTLMDVTRTLARWLAVVVIAAWTVLPAFACAAEFRQMTKPEMACCKKMAGKCDMGMGQHSCCDQTAHTKQANPAIATQTFELALTTALLPVSLPVLSIAPEPAAALLANDGSPPESPPGSVTILRI